MAEKITVKLAPESPEERARMMAVLRGEPHVEAKPAAAAEPLPIWFFVGVILLVYGVIVTLSGLFMTPRPTVLAELRPALWWGAIMCVGGAVFLGIGLGLLVQRSQRLIGFLLGLVVYALLYYPLMIVSKELARAGKLQLWALFLPNLALLGLGFGGMAILRRRRK